MRKKHSIDVFFTEITLDFFHIPIGAENAAVRNVIDSQKLYIMLMGKDFLYSATNLLFRRCGDCSGKHVPTNRDISENDPMIDHD